MGSAYYNLHGLFSFKIEGPKGKLKYIDRQYCYFRSEKPIENPDLLVKVGPFDEEALLGGSYHVVNRKYYVSGRSIFARDSYKVARWKFLIRDFDGQTTIFFDGNYWGYYILYKFFIEPVLRVKLNSKGYFMIHSSSITRDGISMVFPASPSVGKTSTMLNWINNGDGFVADEYTILGKDAVYSYPTPLRLHDYNLTANPFVLKHMNKADKYQIIARTWIFRLSLGYADVTHEVNIWDIFPNINIVDKAPPGKLIVFTKYNGEDVQSRKLTKDRLVDKLQIINQFETTRFNEYLNAYYYVNDVPASQRFWDKAKDNILSILEGDEFIEMLIPKRYTNKTYRQICDIVMAMQPENK